MMFWDSSAIIPLCIDEPKSQAMHDMVRSDVAIVAWWGSPIECQSAFARLCRENFLNPKEEEQVRKILSLLSATWTEIEPSQDIRDTAGRLLRVHPLRAADSLQLAAALVWSGKNPQRHQFVCLDNRLRDAARKEGFILVPEI